MLPGLGLEGLLTESKSTYLTSGTRQGLFPLSEFGSGVIPIIPISPLPAGMGVAVGGKSESPPLEARREDLAADLFGLLGGPF